MMIPQLLVVLFGVLVAPEPIGEGYGSDVVVSPPVKTVDSHGFVNLVYEPLDSRVRRSTNACKIPKTTEDSQLECKIYPSRVTCNQTCMFGYTLKEGIRRKMDCAFDEDRWTPVNKFENCKPFVDCSMTLGPGGKYKCHYNFFEKGTSCDVSCQHFEDMPPVETQTYKCDINGDWTPALPFCAKPGSGIKLASPPKGPRMPSEL